LSVIILTFALVIIKDRDMVSTLLTIFGVIVSLVSVITSLVAVMLKGLIEP
jgi:hypothetical protein